MEPPAGIPSTLPLRGVAQDRLLLPCACYGMCHPEFVEEWSHLRESNPRPTRYECVALPTELRWHVSIICENIWCSTEHMTLYNGCADAAWSTELRWHVSIICENIWCSTEHMTLYNGCADAAWSTELRWRQTRLYCHASKPYKCIAEFASISPYATRDNA